MGAIPTIPMSALLSPYHRHPRKPRRGARLWPIWLHSPEGALQFKSPGSSRSTEAKRGRPAEPWVHVRSIIGAAKPPNTAASPQPPRATWPPRSRHSPTAASHISFFAKPSTEAFRQTPLHPQPASAGRVFATGFSRWSGPQHSGAAKPPQHRGIPATSPRHVAASLAPLPHSRFPHFHSLRDIHCAARACS